jgi:hypothetical protein
MKREMIEEERRLGKGKRERKRSGDFVVVEKESESEERKEMRRGGWIGMMNEELKKGAWDSRIQEHPPVGLVWATSMGGYYGHGCVVRHLSYQFVWGIRYPPD